MEEDETFQNKGVQQTISTGRSQWKMHVGTFCQTTRSNAPLDPKQIYYLYLQEKQ